MLKLQDSKNMETYVIAQMDNGDAYTLPLVCQGLEDAIAYAQTEWAEGQGSASIYDNGSDKGMACVYEDGTVQLETASLVWTVTIES